MNPTHPLPTAIALCGLFIGAVRAQQRKAQRAAVAAHLADLAAFEDFAVRCPDRPHQPARRARRGDFDRWTEELDANV